MLIEFSCGQMLLEEYEAKIQETKVEVHHHEMSKGQITDDQEQARNMAEEDADHEIELQRERYVSDSYAALIPFFCVFFFFFF